MLPVSYTVEIDKKVNIDNVKKFLYSSHSYLTNEVIHIIDYCINIEDNTLEVEYEIHFDRLRPPHVEISCLKLDKFYY